MIFGKYCTCYTVGIISGRSTAVNNIYQEALDELVPGILKIIRSQAESIILYGSVARGTEEPESDVDIAVLVQGPLTTESEEQLSSFIVDMNLKYDKVFSVIDIDVDIFRRWRDIIPFYRNVDDEGIVLWTAA